MSRTNIQLVREYVEEVQNKKHFDRVYDYFSKDCVIHLTPYVGLGLTTDEYTSDKVILVEVAHNGPAFGNLLPGDELIRVQDDHHTWETFADLRNGLWGRGIPGTHLTVTVRRDGRMLTIPLVRGRVEGWDVRLEKVMRIWQDDTLKNWPDLHMEIQLIFGQDDLVTCYSIITGTHQEYHRSAIWSDCSIMRIREGKIVEMWGVEDAFSQMSQIGYRISEPAKELV